MRIGTVLRKLRSSCLPWGSADTGSRWSAGIGLAIGLSCWPAAPASAQPYRIESLSYPVSAFHVEYALENPAHPLISELLEIPLELRVGRGGLLPPHPTTENVRFTLGRVPPDSSFYTAGLRYVTSEILAVFQARGIDGVLVTLPEIDAETGRDLRPGGRGPLLVRIWTGRIESVATVADGDRFGDLDAAERTNLDAHAFIREGSPVQPGGPRGLLRVREIEDYSARLSRHPGRRVDAVLRPGELPGATRVDYHVAESRPWMIYTEVSNTGTDATTDWRERFGFTDTQLTGNDDVLQFDYVTGNFDKSEGVWGSYEAPVHGLPRLRAQVLGSWSQYDASEVGFGDVDANGDQWQAGGRLFLEVFQYRELFVDLFAGASWRHVSVKNDIGVGAGIVFNQDADDDFFLPEAGARLRRHTAISSIALDAFFDHNVGSVAGTDQEQLINLGSVDPDKDFTRFHWEGAVSVYLEPALRWRRWVDPSTPATSTLAHELLVTTRGQVSLGDRLVPQFQQIAGGLYTVRGYQQAALAGDTVLIGSAEYRLHLPRLLLPSSDVPDVPVLGKLRVRPEQVYGRPDWDFIVKAFVDAARVIIEDPQSYESDESLIGIGIGAELHLLRNLSARVDLGWPQRRTIPGIHAHSPEIHTAITLMY